MEEQFDKTEFNKGFRTKNIIFFALSAGQLFMLAVIWFLNSDRTHFPNELERYFIFIVPTVGLISMFLSRFVYSQALIKLNPTYSIPEKLMKYRTFKIISWAILEGAALFSLVAFFVTANYLYVAVFIFVFGFFLFNRPSKEGFVIDMQITGPIKETILRS